MIHSRKNDHHPEMRCADPEDIESYEPEESALGADISSYCGRNESDCSIPTSVERWWSSCRVVQKGGRKPNGDVPGEDNPARGMNGFINNYY